MFRIEFIYFISFIETASVGFAGKQTELAGVQTQTVGNTLMNTDTSTNSYASPSPAQENPQKHSQQSSPQGNTDWTILKGKIKTRFGKLSEDSIESMKGNLDLLSDKLQSTYGYAKDQADKEFSSFKATIHNGNTKVNSMDKEGSFKDGALKSS